MTIAKITKPLFAAALLMTASMAVSANEVEVELSQPEVEATLETAVMVQTKQVVSELQAQLVESLATSLASLIPADLGRMTLGE
jgi:hypothetical protein